VRVTNDLELSALADVVEIRGQLSIETERDTIMHLPRLRKVTRFYGYGAQAQIVFDALEEVTDSFRCQGDCYADKLREVGGELSYSGEASRVLSLPALETAGNFSLSNGPKLTGVSVPKLTHVNSFAVEANPMLTVVDAPGLGAMSTLTVNNNTRLGRLSLLLAAPTKSLTISNNPALALVSLPAVTALEVLSVTQHLNLRRLDLSGLVDANAVELSYLPITDLQLGNLKTASISFRVAHIASALALSLPALESVGLFTFTGSSRAVSLSAPKLSAVSEMELSGLNALATLDLSSLASVSDNLTIVATNLTELDHLDPSRLGSLTYVGQQLAIYFNTSLPQCVVNSIVAGLSPIGPSSVSNGMNCSCPGSFCQ
jgi:hypothetical protein